MGIFGIITVEGASHQATLSIIESGFVSRRSQVVGKDVFFHLSLSLAYVTVSG
jgi:hypothetical protein